MTCREFVEFLSQYLAEELAPLERAEFDRHLAACDHCVEYIDTYRQAILLGKGAYAQRDAAVPEDVPEDLVKAILSARRNGG